MNLKINMTLVAGAVLIGAMATGLGACGKQGVLEQPAPLFGERAKEDYAARRAADAVRSGDAKSTSPRAAADQPDPNADNAPLTTRDLQAPEQDRAPVSQEPIPGENDQLGPPPSLKPPGL